MAENMKVLGNVWKNYLSLKSTLGTIESNKKTLNLLDELKSAGNNKSPQDIVALSAKALKAQPSGKDEALSDRDSEKKQKLEALDQTLQQLMQGWKSNKKAELQRRVTHAKEQLRVLRMMAEQAAASGNKTQAKALARQIVEVARGIAQAAKDIGKSTPSATDVGGLDVATTTTTTITVTGPASAGTQMDVQAVPGETGGAGQVAENMGAAPDVPKDGNIFTAAVQSATTGHQGESDAGAEEAAKGWHDRATADRAAMAYAESSSMNELMREARDRIEEAKRLLKFLSKMATREPERQDYKKLDDEMKNLLGNLPQPNGERLALQADAVTDAGDTSFTAQVTTDSGVSITISVSETTVETPVNVTA